MKILSQAFTDGETIPDKYTCRGLGINPPLQIFDVPADAKSLVLIVRDPDASSGDFIHWLLWNIPPQTVEIAENSMPKGSVSGTNGSEETGFIPPCPPAGIHRYQFQLFALRTEIDLPYTADVSQLEGAFDGKVIESTLLVGLVGQS